MFAARQPSAEPAAAPDGAADRAGLELRLQILGRLAEAGLEIAIALERQAKGEGPAVVQGDIALAYDRIARAVRFTIALQDKLIRKNCKPARAEAEAKDRAEDDAAWAELKEAVERPDRARRIVERVASAEGEEGYRFEARLRETEERLEDEDIHGDVWARPLSEVVAVICAELGLTPDWASLAEEAWAQQEICSGRIGAPLRAWLEGRFAHASPPPPTAFATFPLQPQAASP